MTNRKAILIISLAVFFGFLFFPVPSFALIPVHKSYSLAPKGSASVNVVANGARYRFIVSITPGGHSPNPDGGYVYATDGYKYEQASIEWTVTITGESNVGTPTIEGEESDNNYLKSLRWQTPILNKSYQVKVVGKRWPYTGTGSGPYDPNWESTSSGQITNPIIYDTALIKGGNKYKAGDEVSVDPSEQLTVEAKAKDSSGDIQNSQVTVFWDLKDPAPANQGTGSLPASSTTDSTGLATTTLTCSNTRGDDHIVAGQDKSSSPSSTCDSGKAVVWNMKIISISPTTFTTLTGENSINCIADIKPDSLDNDYNGDIGWSVVDNPNVSGNSGDPTDPSNGNNITWSVTIPPVPSTPNGRGFPLSYKITAQLTIESEAVTSDTYITQDEIDQCRQEYIDMNKSHKPGRNEFVNSGSYSNPGHFTFNEINSGDFSVSIFTIAQHLENIRSAIGDQSMPVNSGYRNPIHNASVGGATNSRHIYGDAADIGRQDWDGDGNQDYDDWVLMKNAAINEGATYIEPYTQTGTWVHMDWG